MPHKIILINGYQMRCRILEEREDCYIVENDDGKAKIFKHAISTVKV